MAVCLGLHRHRDMSHPHVLLIHRIGHPEVTVLGHAVAFLDAAHILRTIALVITSIAHGRYFALHKVQRSVLQAVLRERDAQRPTIL